MCLNIWYDKKSWIFLGLNKWFAAQKFELRRVGATGHLFIYIYRRAPTRTCDVCNCVLQPERGTWHTNEFTRSPFSPFSQQARAHLSGG
jgi:hypothetical protein